MRFFIFSLSTTLESVKYCTILRDWYCSVTTYVGIVRICLANSHLKNKVRLLETNFDSNAIEYKCKLYSYSLVYNNTNNGISH